MAGGIRPSVSAEYPELTGPMAAASVQASPRPRHRSRPPSVTTKAGTASRVMTRPWTRPIAAPTAAAARTLGATPQPATWHEAATRPDRNATLPIDRSISPMMIRMATPAAATATAAVWRISSAALVGVTKMPPEATWKYMTKSSAETKRTDVLASSGAGSGSAGERPAGCRRALVSVWLIMGS